MSTMPDLNTESKPSNLFSVPDQPSQLLEGPGRDVFVYSHQSPSVMKELMDTAQALVSPRGKGVYATDEAPDAIAAALDASIGARKEGGISEKEEKKWTEDQHLERRKKWREFVYNAVPSDYISGVILYSETLLDFKLGPILSNKGIIPGVRANGELTPIPLSSSEPRITSNTPIPLSTSEFRVQGLDNLLESLQRARAAGARFSKWRVPIACASPASGLPSQLSLEIQAETLAQYAAISQEAGLVPIVEPDVEFSADAGLVRSAEVHERAIGMIYERMKVHGVLLEGSLIKPSFPQPGLNHPSRSNVTPEDIALATATVLTRSVPVAVPGVLFLSGGLAPITATKYLAALNALVQASPPGTAFSRLPPLTFSFGRAIQGDAMKDWAKGDEAAAKAALGKWSKACWHAAKGEVM